MKQEYKRPVLFIASLFMAFCAVYFGGRLIGFIWRNTQNGTGKAPTEVGGRDQKIDGRALFGGELYWTGDRGKLDDTYLEKLVVKFGDEIVLNAQIETPVKDYAGGKFPGGGSKEQSVSFWKGLKKLKSPAAR